MEKRKARMLSVDWDYFFPVPDEYPQAMLYDWGHRETMFFQAGPLWDIRASEFLAQGLPLPGTSGEEETFWRRVSLRRGAQLFVFDSHAMAAVPAILGRMRHIVSCDAHHDAGYGGSVKALADKIMREGVTCEDWLAYAALRGKHCEVVYPRWKNWREIESKATVEIIRRRTDDGEHLGEFSRVFICRSGAWVPPWLDERFEAFVSACPAKRISREHDLSPRRWNVHCAEQIASQIDAYVRDAMAQKRKAAGS